MKIQSAYLHAKPTLNNIQAVHNIFDKILTIVDVFTKPFKRDKNKQEPFHAHFEDTRRASRDDWEVRLIELTDNVENFQKTVSFLQQKWYTFQPNELNVREVALFQHLYPIL